MKHAGAREALLVLSLVLATSTVAPTTRADEDDPAGWSVVTDPRGRAFLTYVEEEGGPRLLSIACLRDVDSLVVSSTGIEGLPEEGPGAGLVLSIPGIDWVVYGNVAPDDEGRPTFTADLDIDSERPQVRRPRLVTVLKPPGPVILGVAGAPPVELPLEEIPPRAGIAGPLKTFERVCFGDD